MRPVQAAVLLPAEVLVDPPLAFGEQLRGFVAPVPIGQCPPVQHQHSGRPAGGLGQVASHSLVLADDVGGRRFGCYEFVTTQARLRAASISAGSCECTYVAIVNADDAWPSQAAITAIGTPSRCIRVPHVCRTSCRRTGGTPAAASIRAHRDVSACGLSGRPASSTTTWPLDWYVAPSDSLSAAWRLLAAFRVAPNSVAQYHPEQLKHSGVNQKSA
jgi:hypothetical protein